MVKTSPSNAGGTASIPGWGAKIQHALRPKNLNRSNVVTNSIKKFKDGPHKNIFKKKKKKEKREVARRKRNPHALLLGMQVGSVIMENCMEISQKIENRTIIWSSDSAPHY